MHASDRFLVSLALATVASAARGSAQLGWYAARLPTQRNAAGMVFERSSNRMLMFGGTSNGGNLAATATWSGGELLLLAAAVEPGPRYDSPLVYDAARRAVVLFGGTGPDGVVSFADTWLFQDGSWRAPAVTTSPPARGRHGLAYDAARGKTVLFGGSTFTGGYDDTWEWDGQSWTQLNVAVHPGKGGGGSTMEYHPATQRVLYFGGGTGRETWEWDGAAWKQLPTQGPPTSGSATMVYDEARAQMLLVQTGPSPGYQVLQWKWTGADWSAVPTAHAPTPRFGFAVAYDRGLAGLRLFGGSQAAPSVPLSDTWLWDGTDWARLAAGIHPEPTMSAAMCYDVQRDRVVLLCGAFGAATWEWDGQRWKDVSPSLQPSARASAAMAYDIARGNTVLFGGRDTATLAETWSWSGAGWTRLQPATAPSARYDHAMAYDVARQRVVLFGGLDASGTRLGDTWEWDGVTWTQRSPTAAPSPRHAHGMAYDLWRQRTVLFGGSVASQVNSAETWEWDGTAWTKLTPSTSPAARSGHAMAFDFLRGRTVVSGTGLSGGGPAYDTHEWDGSTWVKTSGTASGPDACMAYAVSARACVAIGQFLYSAPVTSLYGDLTRAQTLAYDQPCAGSRGPLWLTPLSVPRHGETGFALDAWNAPPAQAGALLLASYPVRVTLPGGCLLLVDPGTTFAQLGGQSSGTGFASFALPIPPNPALRGTTVFTQCAVLDPGAPILPLVTSNGIALRIGDV